VILASFSVFLVCVPVFHCGILLLGEQVPVPVGGFLLVLFFILSYDAD
jgi:hypothetical protein